MRRASFFYHPVPVFAPPPPLTKQSGVPSPMSKNLAHLLHPVYDDGKGGGWKYRV